MSEEGYHKPDEKRIQTLKDIANKLRIHSINSTNAAGSGHPTSCCSMAEIMSVLFFHTMRYKVSDPGDPSSDRFVLSKGHAAPVLYAAWAEAGLYSADYLNNLRKIDCELEGHPMPHLPYVDVATGSLGQGLSCSCGMAYTGKYFEEASYRVYCVIGDGEAAEGSVWEAMSFASHYKLDNLVAIFDVNRLGQSEPTSLQHETDVYRNRAEAFGFHTLVVDGHDVEALARAFYEAKTTTEKPTAIIAKTFKGKGIPGIEDEENWHGKPLKDRAEAALAIIKSQISDDGPHKLGPQTVIDDAPPFKPVAIKLSEPPNYTLGEKAAVRVAYGTALAKIGNSCERVVAMDGDTKNSTFALTFKKAHPKRYVECFIAEQNLVGVAVGCATRGRTIPFASTFACFLSRGYDQIRMAGISRSPVNFCGSHVGCSIGEDGPSQMALEDLAMFRAIPNCVVFYPSDAVSCERAIELAANSPNMTFTRSGRPSVPVIYKNDEPFEIGKAKVVRESDNDSVLVIGAGVTLYEAINAAEELAGEGVHVRIMDPFTIKPIDKAGIIKHAMAAGGRIVTVEDHYPEGGIGEAVCHAVSEEPSIRVRTMAVPRVPRSGKSAELMDMFGISAKKIKETVKAFIA